MEDNRIDTLRSDCELANKLWGRTFSALGAMTYREKGEEAAKELWIRLLRAHQKGHYLEGLQKLGIPADDPPAVKAAKYHYLTNRIGGLAMEYIEETPRKVWIRYMAPMWTYAGVTMMAMPGSIRRATAYGWHPNNGALMGSPRLGYVLTKIIMENEPCDEGYFMEYDHDLAPDERLRFETVTHTPEFDPARAPRLDPALWPEARCLKARRKWMREYVNTTVTCLCAMFGEQTTNFLVGQVMRGMAIQFTHELKRDMNIEDNDVRAVASFLYGLQQACGQDVEMTESCGVHRMTLRSYLPFQPGIGEGLRVANFEFPVMAARLINGRVSVTRERSGESETWEIRDTGRWLW